MRILIDIGHPAHIHLFRNFALSMIKGGNEVLFTTRDKEITIELLTIYKLPFVSLGKHYKSLIRKIYGLIKFDILLYAVAKKFKPDIFLSAGSIYAAHCSWILGKPHFTFEDTGNNEQVRLYKPFTKLIFTPATFDKGDYGDKQIKYQGYHEIAYLHPNNFTPDKKILEKMNINENDKYVIIRFVGWDATHDLKYKGLSSADKVDIIKYVSKYARIFITSEKGVPQELMKWQLKISPEQIHNVIAFASLYIGEGATMAMESILLGVPTIYINPITFNQFEDIQKKFGLIWIEHNPEKIKIDAQNILTDESYLSNCKIGRKKLLAGKIDLTTFMIWFFKNYPESLETIKANPDYQFTFK